MYDIGDQIFLFMEIYLGKNNIKKNLHPIFYLVTNSFQTFLEGICFIFLSSPSDL